MNRTFIALAFLLSGISACASTAATTPTAASPSSRTTVAERRAPTTTEGRYTAALVAALDRYEREVRDAVTRWYPDYYAAKQVADRYIDPELHAVVKLELEARGLSYEELTEYAEVHPDFAERQNRLYEARIEELRPHAYGILGRIDPTKADTAVAVSAVQSKDEAVAVSSR
jgi:hypothetical protein